MRTSRPPLLARWVAAGIARLYLGRPDLAQAIAIRYRSVRAFLGGVANEVAYRLGLARAPALLSANLELTNRCNLRCTFCPTGNGRMERPRGHMSDAVFRAALASGRPLEFVLLFQWGEPLLHPRFFELARRARSSGARTLVTTNGTLLDERRVQGLLESGIDRVTVSVDGDARTHERVRGVPLERVEAGLRRLVDARNEARAPTAIDVSMVVAPETEVAAAEFRRRFEGVVDRVQTIPLLTEGRRRTRCREPWRGGLVVLQDGTVTVCCVDHDGELAVGDVREQGLREIWNGERMRRLRAAHAAGDLPPLCARCTEYPTDHAAPRFSRREEASRTPPPVPAPATRRALAEVAGTPEREEVPSGWGGGGVG
jgi:radical SAM protein with 4Fe4S-binding SPASM domain